MADPIEIEPGERETLISSDDVREFFADVRSDVEVLLSETFGGTGERAAPDDRGKLAASHGTQVVAFNPGSAAARIELSPTGRTAGLGTDGFYFDRQTRVRQEADVYLQSSASVVEINADQTTDIGPNVSATTVINPDPGEIWTLRGLYLNAPDVASSVNTVQSHSFTIKTAGVGVEIGFGRVERSSATSGSGTQRLRYQAGEFIDEPESGDTVTTGSSLTADRDDMTGNKFDAGNGLVVVYNNNTQETQTGNRIIRAQFEVTKVD
jgi:hypothetical protein